MRNIICLCGYPAAGKSHLSSILSKELGYPVFELDDIFTSNFQDEKGARKKVFDSILETISLPTCNGVIIDDLNHLKSIRHHWFKKGFKRAISDGIKRTHYWGFDPTTIGQQTYPLLSTPTFWNLRFALEWPKWCFSGFCLAENCGENLSSTK